MSLFKTAIGPNVLHTYPIADGYTVKVALTRHPADPDRMAYTLLADREYEAPSWSPERTAVAHYWDTCETEEEAVRAAQAYVSIAKHWLADPNRQGFIAVPYPRE